MGTKSYLYGRKKIPTAGLDLLFLFLKSHISDAMGRFVFTQETITLVWKQLARKSCPLPFQFRRTLPRFGVALIYGWLLSAARLDQYYHRCKDTTLHYFRTGRSREQGKCSTTCFWVVFIRLIQKFPSFQIDLSLRSRKHFPCFKTRVGD